MTKQESSKNVAGKVAETEKKRAEEEKPKAAESGGGTGKAAENKEKVTKKAGGGSKPRERIKKIAFILCCVTVAASVFFTFLPVGKEDGKEKETIVLTVWHADLFEGGQGSRKGVLSSIAKKYEKTKKSVYISVIELSREGMEQKIAANIVPDIVSFSCGAEGIEEYAKKLPVKDGFAGYSADGYYAAAWAYGGYFLLTHESGNYESLILSDNGYNSPYVAAYLGKVRVKNASSFSPEKAFATFRADEKSALLGTQRDLCRAEKAGIKVNAEPVCGFDDLVQYMSITSAKRYEESLDFLRFVLDSGEEIEKLRLMPASGKVKNADDAVLKKLSEVSASAGVWAFEKREVTRKMNEYAKCALEGKEEESKNLKNSLKSLKIN